MLDVLVLQSVDQRVEVLKIIDMSTPVEQVIDVRKIISQDSILQRAALRVPQLVEQLVPSFSSSARSATVPLLWSRPDGELLVEVGHTTHPVAPLGTHLQSRAIQKYWAPLQFHRSRSRSWTRWLTSL